MASANPQWPLLDLRAMFYLVGPNETSFKNLEDVPNFVDGAMPYFIILVISEYIILRLKGKPMPRFNDGINSISHGILSLLHTLMFRPIELVIYTWIFDNYCLVALPWNSGWVWLLAFLSTDFCYYWFHRFSHESNIIWASHQVHHSSEEYNLTTALRQSLMQKYYSMCLYFPMAFILPTPMFYVHQQLNLLYQFWIHTEAIESMGPLEYILNTPSHHRVHHGRNPYCIDKNYGGTLIIWDRIFNTFQAEKEKVIYGLVHTNLFWSPIFGQFYHYLYILGLVKTHKGVTNKLSAVIKGPGWEPGKPWTGLVSDLPEVKGPVQKYDSDLPLWANVYIVVHFCLLMLAYIIIAPNKQSLTAITAFACVLFFILSISTFGALFDHRKYATLLEFFRCLVLIGVALYFQGADVFSHPASAGLFLLFVASTVFWGFLSCWQYGFRMETKKTE